MFDSGSDYDVLFGMKVVHVILKLKKQWKENTKNRLCTYQINILFSNWYQVENYYDAHRWTRVVNCF